MRTMHNRLRQQRWELDERRRFLIGLEALAGRLRRDAQRLHWEIEEEQGAGALEQKPGVSYPIFLEPLLDRRKKLEGTIAEIDAQIAEAQEAVAAAEQEISLHEAAFANRVKANSTTGRRARR